MRRVPVGVRKDKSRHADSDPARMETVLWTTAEIVRRVSIQCQPYMPESSAKLLDLLAIAADARNFEHVAAAHELAPGTPLPAPQGVFPRYVEQEQAD